MTRRAWTVCSAVVLLVAVGCTPTPEVPWLQAGCFTSSTGPDLEFFGAVNARNNFLGYLQSSDGSCAGGAAAFTVVRSPAPNSESTALATCRSLLRTGAVRQLRGLGYDTLPIDAWLCLEDNEAPQFDAPRDLLLQASGPSGRVATYTAGPAIDRFDGERPVTCAPTTGTLFPVGITTVNCDSADTAGNRLDRAFTIEVTTRSLWRESGCVQGALGDIWFSGVENRLADAEMLASTDGTCTGASEVATIVRAGDSSDALVACRVLVPAGAALRLNDLGYAGFPVDGYLCEIDSTPPDLVTPPNLLASSDGGPDVTVAFPVSASDNAIGTVGLGCSPSSGSAFAVGVSTVTCLATDPVGLQTTGSFQVEITPDPLWLSASCTDGTSGVDLLFTGRQNTLDNAAAYGSSTDGSCSGPWTPTTIVTSPDSGFADSLCAFLVPGGLAAESLGSTYPGLPPDAWLCRV